MVKGYVGLIGEMNVLVGWLTLIGKGLCDILLFFLHNGV
jgi:hypothetical protein